MTGKLKAILVKGVGMGLFRSMTLIGAFTVPLAAAGTVLYQYNFSAAKVSGSTVPNQATGMFSGVSLQLIAREKGDWSFANKNQGIRFKGDTMKHQSVAEGRPAKGDSIDVPNADTVAAGAQFTFEAPTASNCNDTPNVAQVGRSGKPGIGQVKIQLDNCNAGQPTHVECRIAGSKSTVS